jgi:hypothetical protein
MASESAVVTVKPEDQAAQCAAVRSAVNPRCPAQYAASEYGLQVALSVGGDFDRPHGLAAMHARPALCVQGPPVRGRGYLAVIFFYPRVCQWLRLPSQRNPTTATTTIKVVVLPRILCRRRKAPGL